MQALADRVQGIRGYLAPATTDQIAVQVARLFVVLAKRGEGFDDEAQRISLYVEILSDVPRFALERTCTDFLYGKAGDGKWVPTPAEIRTAALKHVTPWLAELDRINPILNAAVVAPNDYGQRAANLKHIQETLHMLRGAIPKCDIDTRWAAKMQSIPASELTPKVAAEKWLEAYEAPKDAPAIGPSLQKYIERNRRDITGAA